MIALYLWQVIFRAVTIVRSELLFQIKKPTDLVTTPPNSALWSVIRAELTTRQVLHWGSAMLPDCLADWEMKWRETQTQLQVLQVPKTSLIVGELGLPCLKQNRKPTGNYNLPYRYSQISLFLSFFPGLWVLKPLPWATAFLPFLTNWSHRLCLLFCYPCFDWLIPFFINIMNKFQKGHVLFRNWWAHTSQQLKLKCTFLMRNIHHAAHTKKAGMLFAAHRLHRVCVCLLHHHVNLPILNKRFSPWKRDL